MMSLFPSLAVFPGCYVSCDAMTTPTPYCWGRCTGLKLRNRAVIPMSLGEGGEFRG